MHDVKLKVPSSLLADYLSFLFPPSEPGGPLVVHCGYPLGRLLCAHCQARKDPEPEPVPDPDHKTSRYPVIVPLTLPDNEATRPLKDKWLWYPPADTAAVSMALRATFDLDFDRYYLNGVEMGFRKKDVVSAFILSRNLFSSDSFDALHKRAYRRSQKRMDALTRQLLNKAQYIDRSIKLTGLSK